MRTYPALPPLCKPSADHRALRKAGAYSTGNYPAKQSSRLAPSLAPLSSSHFEDIGTLLWRAVMALLIATTASAGKVKL